MIIQKYQMFPDRFKQRIITQNYVDAGALLNALGEPSPVTIRINKAKWNKRPLDSESVPWCKKGFYLTSRPSFTMDPLFHSGCYYPQEASGMFLEQVFLQSVQSMKNIRVLDLCGAPGGKSLLLSDLIGPGNLLVANEVIRSRALILSETITKWGAGNTLVTQGDPSAFGKVPGFFDVVFVDAPCSGEGMFRTEVAVREWSPENAVYCAGRQKRILMEIWPALKENGILIYSTCTFNPGENEENIKWLIERNEAEAIRLDINSFPGITEISFQGIYGYGFYPDKIRGEGFFISAIRKKGKQDQIHLRSNRQAETKPDKSDLKIAASWTDFNEDRIMKWGDEIIAAPCDMDVYQILYGNLRVISAGTKIYTVKRNNSLPSHELALSSGLKRETFPRHEIGIDEAVAYLRRDNLRLTGIHEGWNILTYKGVNLGFIKNLGARVNNYFPVGWRIRLDASAINQANPVSWIG